MCWRPPGIHHHCLGSSGKGGFFLLPTLQSSHDDLFAYGLSVGYPIGDVLLLAGLVWMLSKEGLGARLSVRLLSAGVLVGLGADVIYGYQNIQGTSQAGGLSDAAYMLSWALFAWSAFAETGRRRGRINGRPEGSDGP